MPALKCPFAGCMKQVVNADKDVAITLFNAHVHTHTVNAGRNHGSDQEKSEELVRPRITQGMSLDSWNCFQVRWELFKNDAGLSEAEYGLQLMYCCSEEIMEQLYHADPLILAKSEIEQLEAIRKLAGSLETIDMAQEVSELSRAFHAMVQEEAELMEKCAEQSYREERDTADSTNWTGKNALVNGRVGAETYRETLVRRSVDDSSLLGTAIFIEHGGSAQDAFKGEAAALRTGYRKQGGTVRPTDEAKLLIEPKCRGCVAQVNHDAGLPASQLREHGLCKKCWKQTLQRRDTEKHRAKADTVDADRSDEASSLFISNGQPAPRQGGDSTNVRNEANKHNNLTRKRRSKGQRPDITEVSMGQLDEGVAVTPNHHILDFRPVGQRRKLGNSQPCGRRVGPIGTQAPGLASMTPVSSQW